MANRYDKSYYYDRQPRRRADEPRTVPGRLAVGFVCALFVAMVAAFCWLALTDGDMGARRAPATATEPTPSPKAVTREEPMDTVGGTSVYVMVDPDTDMEYLVTDKGGICRREELVADEGVAEVG